MKQKILLAVVLAIIIITNSCNSSPIEPEPQPGRRDYVWTVDTLVTPFNTIQGMWGNSRNNIYVVGPGGMGDDRVWHFDGNKWNKPLEYIAAGPKTIYGFSNSNIWIGDDNGKLLNYDGTSWNLKYTYKPKKQFVSSIITDLYGDSPSEIYAVGVTFYNQQTIQRGFILKYDGVSWKEIFEADYNSQFLAIRKDKGRVMIFGIKSGFVEADTLAFWQWKTNNLNEIYSNSGKNIIYANISQIGDNYYYVIGRDINKYVAEKFSKMMTINETNFGYALSGRSEKDFFVNMVDGLAHYNGTNIEYLFKFNNPFTYLIKDPFITETEVFFIMYEGAKGLNMILHGKLKE